MAEKRMFTKKVTDADEFIALPSSAQALYLHLNMTADDDGFNNQVQLAMFKAHASVDDVKVLLAKRFIIQFENGVIVIKHWRMANAIRKDRYTPTSYQDEFKLLKIKDNDAYTLDNLNESAVANGLPDGCQMVANGLPQISIDKNSIEENRIDKNSNTHADGVWDIHKHTNVENLSHFLNYEEYKDKQFFLDNMKLYESIKTWMDYKDQRKPKRDNFYISIKAFLNTVVKNAKKYGADVVIEVINDSIAANYQGIVWDWCDKKPVKKSADIDDVLDRLV